MSPWIWLGVFILFSFISEAMTGFGSIVIALSLGALFLPLSDLLTVLVPLSVCMSSIVLSRNYKHIHWPTLLRMLLPAMALGTLVGYSLRPHVDPTISKILFGVFVVWFASRELYKLVRKPNLDEARPKAWTLGLIFGAGITHGMFASGGPLLVYALAGNRLDKKALRATLVSVWFTLNVSMTIASYLGGTLVPALPRIAAYLPVIAMAWFIGEKLHDRVDELQFRKALYGLLVIVGLLLVGPNLFHA